MRKWLLIIGLISSSNLMAQKTLTGIVKDAKTNQPLGGVSVRTKSSNSGTTTNNDGIFRISVTVPEVLEVSMIGYKVQTIKIADQTDVEIRLESNSTDLTEIVFVGSRGAGRVRTETPVPIDVIKVSQIGLPTAKADLTSLLNYAAPSFNYNKQSGADGADHIDIATLRGLGPDHTLVLINGKRWHKTAFVGLFGTRGKGSSGTDLNAIPEDAIDRVEILRDGASAQYGSDAIAGVMNLILKKDVNHLTLNMGYSVYNDPKYNSSNWKAGNQYYYSQPLDGSTFSLGANYGLNLGKNGGFINFTVDFLNQAKTFRQVGDTNVLRNPDALPLNTSRRAFGDGSVTTAGAMYNAEIPLGSSDKTTFYSFGGYNYKFGDAYAYSRNNDPTRSPADSNGVIFVPSIMHKSVDGTIYYNPHIQSHITDASLVLGVRGDAGKGWSWDLSNSFGHNNFHYYGDKTFNASLGVMPNHFDDGGFYYNENTVNLDFNKSFSTVAQGLNLGLGAEYRYENYVIYKGEDASWKLYNNTGQAPGSQGFPGFRPSDEINANRSNVAGYVDAELNVSRKWLVDAAIRLENYSDFGFTSNYKFATRFKITDNLNIRGSISTGFRAPSLQQINFSNTLTTFSGNTLTESHIAANSSPITKAAGIPNLTQEKSINASVGFSWKPFKGFTVTLDGYMIKITDRVVLSGIFNASDTVNLPKSFTDQLRNLNVASAQFFANAVNTTNTGLDLVLEYNKKWGNQGLRILLAGNIQNVCIDKINVPAKLNGHYVTQKTFFSDREESFLIASAPNAKASLALDYTVNRFGLGAHLTYFGQLALLGFGYTGPGTPGSGLPGDPNISGSFAGIDPYVPDDTKPGVVLPERFVFTPKLVTDIYASYRFSSKLTLFVGADNVFNVHPDFSVVQRARYEAYDNESGGPWDSVQMGYNGRRLFGKLAFNF